MRSCLLALALVACSNDSPAPTSKPVTGESVRQSAAPKKLPAPDKPLPNLAADTGGATGKVSWGVGLGGLDSDTSRAIAVDSKGDSVIVGTFDGEAEFGSLGKRTSAGGTDAFVLMLDPQGKPLWVQTWGGKREDTANAVAIKGDTIVVCGNFLDDLTIGEFHHKSAGSDDLYVAAFDLKGEPQWVFTSGGVDSDGANAIAPTPDGGWIVGGSFKGEAKFGETIFKSKGGTDALLLKIDKDLTIAWVKQFGGNYSDMVRAVAVDAQGSIYVQGVFAYRANWGGEDLKAGGGSDNDIVLAKYDANGDHIWSKRFGGDFNDVAGGIALDPSGHIMMTGSFDRTASFGEGDSHTSIGESDIVVARFTPDGKLEWAKTFGAKREDVGWGIAVDAAGNSVTTGWFQNTIDFGKGELVGKGNKDVFVLKLDVKGNTLWATSWGDHDHDQGRGVALDDKGNAYVTGIYRFTLDAVTPPLESRRAPDDKLPQADIFVIRLER